MNAQPSTTTFTNAGKFFIDGAWVEPSGPEVIKVIDSTTEEVFSTVGAANEADINKAVAAARRAFDDGPWPKMTPHERAAYLLKIADRLEHHSAELTHCWIAESGAISANANYIAQGIAGLFRMNASLADTFQWTEKLNAIDGLPALVVREPAGVVGAIIPWNVPSIILGNKIGPALMAGCTVIIKGSPEAPMAPLILAQACEDVGLPPGVLNALTAERDVSELLVKHPDVDKISFTGSTAAGRRIASLCGERIARVMLELGGKSPAIILDDYDLGAAAQSLAWSGSMMAGQGCNLPTRIIVNRKRHDDFVDALAAAYSSTRVGDPYNPETQMGPLASAMQRSRVEDYIAKGKAEGARLATGGARPAHFNRGFFIEPTVFANVDNHATIAQEEIFGPVLSVIPANDEEDAIRIANDTIYGLNSVVFSNDVERVYSIGRRIRAGTVAHNGLKASFNLPFGGFKQSGIGRECGPEGLVDYLETKTMIFEQAPEAART